MKFSISHVSRNRLAVLRERFARCATVATAFVLAFVLCVPVQALGDDLTGSLPDNTSINPVEADPINGVTINMFNYDDSANTRTDGLGPNGFVFFHGDYVSDPEDTKEGSVDGTGTGKDTYNYAKLVPTLVNGYPYVKDTEVEVEDSEGNATMTTVEGSMKYLFDTSGSYFKGTMTNGGGLFQYKNGYYIYDSGANAAYFDGGGFTLYDTVVRPSYTSDTGTDIQRSNFLPFNKVTDGATVVDTTISDGTKAARIVGNTDLWFGMTVDFDFYMPKEGKMNNEAMVFDFHGDDDVFVYIDNVLILDIGGTHGSQSATIDFSTGIATDPRGNANGNTLYSIFRAALGDEVDESQFVDSNNDGILDTFANYTEHSLKFYYMERGGNISYCRLKYNMPILPDGNVTVKKAIEGTLNDTTENVLFDFQVFDEAGNTVPSATYSVMHTDGTVSEDLKTDEKGKFSLKANEVATFQLTSEKSYYVVELSSEHAIASGCVTTDGNVVTESENPNQSANFEVMPDKHIGVVFTNTLNGNLEISKVVTGNGGDRDREWLFEISLDGDTPEGEMTLPLVIENAEGVAVEGNDITFAKDGDEGVLVGSLSLTHGQTARISQIPAYTSYSVKEQGAALNGVNASGYKTTVSGSADGAIRPGITSETLFTNDYVDPKAVALGGMKVLYANGAEASLESYPFSFQFELSPIDGAKMPEGVSTLIATVDNTTGLFEFAPIAYTFSDIGKDYSYVISEINGGNSSILYATPCTVTVSVGYDVATNELTYSTSYADANGTASTSPISFINAYNVPNAISFQLSAEKELRGGFLADGQFSFILSSVDGAPMPNGDTNVTVANDAQGNIAFPAIIVPDGDVKALGEGKDEVKYSYEITEVNGNQAYYTYDDSKYLACVTVTKNDANELVADIAYSKVVSQDAESGENLQDEITPVDEIVFVNGYYPPFIPAVIDFQLEVKKTLVGAELEAGAFTFTLSAIGDAPMPRGAGSIVVATNNASGMVSFPAITVSAADAQALGLGTADSIVYEYSISEQAGDDPNYEYDNAPVTARVVITKSPAGKLEADIMYSKAGYANGNAANVFVNEYTAPLPDEPLPDTGDDPLPDTGNEPLPVTGDTVPALPFVAAAMLSAICIAVCLKKRALRM